MIVALLRFVFTHSNAPFVLYRIGLGLITPSRLWLGVLSPW